MSGPTKRKVFAFLVLICLLTNEVFHSDGLSFNARISSFLPHLSFWVLSWP